MSDSLRLHGLQHFRLPCPLPSPGIRPNSWLYSPCGHKVSDTTERLSLSRPLSLWCHPGISSSVVPFAFVIWLLSKFSAHLQPLFSWDHNPSLAITYLVALGLSCGTQDLLSSWQQVGPLVMVWWLLGASCGI